MKPSEAYFLAKRQIVEHLDARISKIEQILVVGESVKLEAAIMALEEARSYIRNTMLWKKEDGE